MNARRRFALILVGWIGLLAWPSSVAACSPPFERPTIRALGPAQLVVLGAVGERVPGGRLFHVERWFNGGEPGTPIVIAFKEGEPVGDCSYPVSTGERKIIAPSREPDGRLYADLVTLQADPVSAEGQRYVAEAEALFGPGVVPPQVGPEPRAESATPASPLAPGALAELDVGLLMSVMVAVVLALGSAALMIRRRRRARVVDM